MTKQGYFVIDAHCHVYPEKIAARAGKITRGSRFLKDPESVVRKLLEQGKCKPRKGKRK